MSSIQFWDALAPHHSRIENNYFDLASLRQIQKELLEPVLVVGAGQGLIVAELRKLGRKCDGVDFSPQMVRQAKNRRGLDLIQADAKAMPLGDGTYGTIVYATGVIDFTSDENAIHSMLNEGQRVVQASGTIFIAFYRLSAALEDFVTRVGLLRDNMISQQESLQMYLLNPAQMITWIANRTGAGRLRAAMLLFRMSALGSLREKALTFKMQKIFHTLDDPNALIRAAPEKAPYRNEAEIRKLLDRLAAPLEEIRSLPTCWIARIGSRSRGRTGAAIGKDRVIQRRN